MSQNIQHNLKQYKIYPLTIITGQALKFSLQIFFLQAFFSFYLPSKNLSKNATPYQNNS